MSIFVAVCGNEAVAELLENKLQVHYPKGQWKLASYDIYVPKRISTDLYAHPMSERTETRASQVLTQVPESTIAVAFESGIVQTAMGVVNLVDMDVLEMSPEELDSPEVKKEIRRRSLEAVKASPRFATISVASVVDAQGKIFGCMVFEVEEEPHVVFHWGEGNGTIEPALVEVGDRIPNPAPFVQAVSDVLLTYHKSAVELPTMTN